MSNWKAFPMDEPWPKDKELVLASNTARDEDATECYFSLQGYSQRHFIEKKTGQPFGLMNCCWKPLPPHKKIRYAIADNLSSLLTVLKAFLKGN
jgi:hypothetical protein